MKTLMVTDEELDLMISEMERAGFFPERDKIVRKLRKARAGISRKGAKTKGIEFQKKVCEMIAKCIELDYNQSDDKCFIHARSANLNGVDVVLTGLAAERFPFSVECKAQERLCLSDWIRQSMKNKSDDTDWMLVFKMKNLGSVPIVVMEFEKFLQRYYF